MNKIEKIKEIMRHADVFNMYDASEADAIIKLIAEDEYDIADIKILEIPHPEVICFGNYKKEIFFDVVKFYDNKWQFSYLKSTQNGVINELAHSIQEAVEKYEFD